MSFTHTVTITTADLSGQIASTKGTYTGHGHAAWEGTVPPSIPIAAPGTVTPGLTSGGALTANTYFYKVTALNAGGETTASPEATDTTSGGNLTITLTWSAVPSATSYRIYRGTTTNLESVYFTSSSASFTDVGAAGTAGTVPTVNTTGGNHEVDLSFLHADVISYIGSSDQAMTIKTNTTGGDDTLTIGAGMQAIWNTDSTGSIPWQHDVTKVFLTNGSASVVANVKLEFVRADG